MSFIRFVLVSFSSLMVLSNALNLISNDGCDVTKGCLFSPKGCNPTTNCSHALTYTPQKNAVLFELSAKIPLEIINTGRFGRYVAVGFSDDGQLGDDSMTMCLYSTVVNQKKTFLNLAYKSISKVNSLITDNKANAALREIESGFVDNHIICRFTQTIEPKVKDARIRNLNNTYHLFITSDSADSQSLIPNSHESEPKNDFYPFFSINKINVVTMTEINGSQTLTASIIFSLMCFICLSVLQ